MIFPRYGCMYKKNYFLLIWVYIFSEIWVYIFSEIWVYIFPEICLFSPKIWVYIFPRDMGVYFSRVMGVYIFPRYGCIFFPENGGSCRPGGMYRWDLSTSAGYWLSYQVNTNIIFRDRAISIHCYAVSSIIFGTIMSSAFPAFASVIILTETP